MSSRHPRPAVPADGLPVPLGVERPEAVRVLSDARLGLAAIVAGALCIAASPILVRLSELGPTATGFHRVFLAAPLFALWTLIIRRRRPRSSRAAGGETGASAGGGSGRPGVASEPDVSPSAETGTQGVVAAARGPRPALVVFAGLVFAGDLAAWHWSLEFTTVANSTFIANLAPVFVTTLAWFLFRERVTGVFLLGMVMAIAGASLMVKAGFDVDPSRLAGDFLALATSVLYASYLVSVKSLRRSLSTAHLMLYTSLVTSVCLLPLSLAGGESLLPRSLRGLAILLALAWVSQALGQGLIAFGMAHVPASFSSVSLLLQPVAAALLAWAVLSEAVTWWQGLGGVGVLAGIVLARMGSGSVQSPAARTMEGRPV